MPFVHLDRGGPAWSFQQGNGGQAGDQPDADDPEGVGIGRHIGFPSDLSRQRHQRLRFGHGRIGDPAAQSKPGLMPARQIVSEKGGMQ